MNQVQVLMVEDNGGDVVLLDEALTRAGVPHRISVATDGVEAMRFLRKEGPYRGAPRPDLIVLDLKLPRKGGREVLSELKPDPDLRAIPVVVLSSSRSELELVKEYDLPDESRITKPSTFTGYVEVAKAMEAYRRKMTPAAS